MPLSGILGDVTQERLRGVLLKRRPALLDAASPEQVAQFETFVRSAATEVVLLTGYDPPAGPIRDLAVDVIINETGSRIEYALYPEQQAQGADGRGYYLHQLYLEQLGRLTNIITSLGGIPTDGGTGTVLTGASRPRGRFPAPARYPDPVIDYTSQCARRPTW